MESVSASVTRDKRPNKKPNLGVRVVVFVFIEIITLMLMGAFLSPWAGALVTGAVSSFTAAALANAFTLRIYERGKFSDIGLQFSPATGRNSFIGFLGGFGAAAFCAGIPLLTGMATLDASPEQPGTIASFIFVSIILLIGAVGEEMLFRGYGFQLLLKRWGTFATVLPIGVLFAWAHSGNPDVTYLALFNTFLWGVLFGLCFIRSGDLWLPIGVHFGWNWALPLFGVNVSGFTMSVTGYKMVWSAGTLWSGGGYGLEGSLLTLFVLPLLVWYLWKAPVMVQKPFLLREAGQEEE